MRPGVESARGVAAGIVQLSQIPAERRRPRDRRCSPGTPTRARLSSDGPERLPFREPQHVLALNRLGHLRVLSGRKGGAALAEQAALRGVMSTLDARRGGGYAAVVGDGPQNPSPNRGSHRLRCGAGVFTPSRDKIRDSALSIVTTPPGPGVGSSLRGSSS